jgi:hypothetical protein
MPAAVSWIDAVAAAVEPADAAAAAQSRTLPMLRFLLDSVGRSAPELLSHPHAARLIHALRVLSWATAAVPLLGGILRLEDLSALLLSARAIPIHDGPLIRHLANLFARAMAWRAEVKQLMAAPAPVDTAPFVAAA